MIRKGEVNSNDVISQADDLTHRENGRADSDVFDGPSLDKPDRLPLEALLPFLEERIKLTMPSELRHLDGVLDYLNERMLRLGIVRSEDSEVLIALDEAIVNAIKHGNKCDPRKAVHIVAEFTAEGARFTVTDEGPGFAVDKVPDPTAPCRLLEPSGRGLLLINHIMDEVCFNSSGNQLEMFKRSTSRLETQVHSSNGDGSS